MPLIDSFELGNALKSGVPTVIVGKPNAGKSTLLNIILNEEKAIVSEIAGTTRDIIEDQIQIDGIKFRLIDTAGLRKTEDAIELIGVERALQQIDKASLVILLFDADQEKIEDLDVLRCQILEKGKKVILVGNKLDLINDELKDKFNQNFDKIHWISASKNQNIDDLKSSLVEIVTKSDFKTGDTMITNLRHFDHLTKTNNALNKVLQDLEKNITGDFIALEIRYALESLGEITGQITTDDLLANIFSKFCIGK
jgi:tRNA modification GTPase